MITKPTFGVKTETNTNKDNTNERVEVGAIWENTSATNKTYMKIKLALPKSELLKLIENSSGSDNVNLDFVAFKNRHQNEQGTRPTFRIYPESSGGTKPSFDTTSQK